MNPLKGDPSERRLATVGAPLIIWLNGMPGSGKTTVAKLLSNRYPQSTVVDPEVIGVRMLAEKGIDVDYQYLAEWQIETCRAIELAARSASLVIVPMTLYDPAVRHSIAELIRQLRKQYCEVELVAELSQLRSRVIARGSAVNWCLESIPRFSEFPDLDVPMVNNEDSRDIADTVREVATIAALIF